eukprot:2172466-Rhodomonas_salina.1
MLQQHSQSCVEASLLCYLVDNDGICQAGSVTPCRSRKGGKRSSDSLSWGRLVWFPGHFCSQLHTYSAKPVREVRDRDGDEWLRELQCCLRIRGASYPLSRVHPFPLHHTSEGVFVSPAGPPHGEHLLCPEKLGVRHLAPAVLSAERVERPWRARG